MRLRDQQDLRDLATIRAWAISKGPSTTTSSHWWYLAPTPDTPAERVLDKPQKEAFARIAQCDTIVNMYKDVFGENHVVDVLDGMNEVYVSSPHTVKNTSDEVFYTRHIDGPYYFVPFASCYRMIIGLDANEEITTKFPMVPTELAAQNGDVLAFDFHREVLCDMHAYIHIYVHTYMRAALCSTARCSASPYDPRYMFVRMYLDCVCVCVCVRARAWWCVQMYVVCSTHTTCI